MTIIDSRVNRIGISCIHTDENKGTWWAIGTEKEWLEIRTTKTGKFRVLEVKKGTHPYFTPTQPSNKSKEMKNATAN